ncbi:TIGR03435 family protein [Granulicella sp. WH15]|uniref:M56 family metallopeptidase n=1 Tax=Granulicella sp. WH15 TaxID=2602070 RepID=UPI0013677406|nr:M56 family metallopeptidase [Granulicella sp. WH15]QHN05084.1 TIGR03435 family protein [Granulicella sp. WH15]
MNLPVSWNAVWTIVLVHHLWQSTLVCLGVWALTLMLRRNSARMRFRLWMLASVKFLLPFGLLVMAGESLSARRTAPGTGTVFSMVMEGPATQPLKAQAKPPQLASPLSRAAAARPEAGKKPVSVMWPLAALWLMGSLMIAGVWLWRWSKLRAMIRRGTPLPERSGLRAVMVSSDVEPGIFGIVRPVLVLPQGVTGTLTPTQLEAIVEHELCHARRRDNLTAAMHMLVSVVFWFHPLVWWIGKRMIAERETACDEAVLERSHSALEYAEGILNVCKFYLEVPVACVSGVTGADLKKRIAHILSGDRARSLTVARKLVLSVAGVLSIGVPVVFGALHASRSYAQAPAKQNIDDAWQGTLHLQKDLRLVLKIVKAPDGTLKTTFYSIDQAGQPLQVKETLFQGSELKLNVEAIDGTYVGKISPDGTTITGEWKQGDTSHPLILARATAETAWTIPEPPPKLPPMAADADPSFEVATIKPTDPASKGKGFGGPPRRFRTGGTTLNDLVMFVYGVNTKQIVGAPAWTESDRFDITTGQPDAPGAPSEDQVRTMMRKLLAARFGLKFHKEKKEMSAYILSVAKDGPKLTKSESDPNAPHAFFFTKLGNLTVRNATMEDFVNGMQGAVFDRPVVDHTGIAGRWNCSLKWTPDETQFQVFGVKITPNEAADAPPPIFTAIQEQIGLKLDAGKAMVEVMVIDHVDKPSEN